MARWSPRSPSPARGRTGWVGALGRTLLALLAVDAAGDVPGVHAAGPIRIGALTESWGPTPHVVGLRAGLRELGHVEGEEFVIGVRFTKGVDSLPAWWHPRENDGRPLPTATRSACLRR